VSLAIKIDDVAEVLMAGEWHVVEAHSFDLDSFEFLHDDLLVHGGGNSGICATGFSFTDGNGNEICGPLTSVQAVKVKRTKR
jgi:hypothetical protein